MNKIFVCENLVKIANELDLNGETEIADEITEVAVSLGENVKEAQFLPSIFGLKRRRPAQPPAVVKKYPLPKDYGAAVDKMIRQIRNLEKNPQAMQQVETQYATYVNHINQAYQIAQQIANYNPVQPAATQPVTTPAATTAPTKQPVAPQTPAAPTPQAQPPRA